LSPGDLRTVVLVTGMLLGGLLRRPQLAIATVTGVAFWQGYDIGRLYGAPGGLNHADNLGSVLLLGFVSLLLLFLWSVMTWEARRGKMPLIPPGYLLVVLAFTLAGFGTGVVGSALFGRVPDPRLSQAEDGALRPA
jgi:hypothetical protein